MAGLPVVLLLLLLVVLTGGLLKLAAEGQDRIARETSTTTVRAALSLERESLERIVRGYSWQSAAVENLIFDFDPGRAKDNLEWLRESSRISHVFVFGPRRQPIHATFGGEPVAPDHPVWRQSDFVALISRARAQPDKPGEAATAYIAFPDGVHLATASKLLEKTDKTGHPPYPEKGILVATRKIDQELIDRIGTDFQLPNLALLTDGEPASGGAAVPLPGPEGEPIAQLTWIPPQPGAHLLKWLVLPLGVVFALVGGVIAMIIVRARRENLALRQALEAQVAAQKQLEHLARHDSLTDLPNRTLFLEHLTIEIAHALRYGSSFTLHYLDLDGFKSVNDTFGHPAGDDLLRELAARFSSIVRATDTIARFGGDEFVVLQRGTGDPQDARLLAERLIGAVQEPFESAYYSARVTLSVGIVFDVECKDPGEILRKVDRALYRAKGRGGNCYEFYEATLDDQGIPRAASQPRFSETSSTLDNA